MLARAEAAQPAWDALGGAERAALLVKASDLFEAHAAEIISLCQREAGKTLTDAVLELREAVDFLRYYACEARMLFSAPQPLPGPTGEQNLLRLHGRGVFATISPWNFPLAIFIGMAVGGARRGQHGDRQARRADPADRRAGGQAVPRGRHPRRRAPARAR